jgi:cell division protease FtsH
MTAYHEAGHAIVGRLVEEHDPVYKVSIMPRGRALGVTMFLPEKDSYSLSKRKINSQISALFGGRIAEEIIFGADSVTTGASNDIQRATELANNMVKKWGLSDMGPLAYGEDEGEVFLGRQVTQHKHISDETFQKIDTEITKIIDVNYKVAEKILKKNVDILHSMAKALMKYETIDVEQIDALMAGNEPKESAFVADLDEISTEFGLGKEPEEEIQPNNQVKSDLKNENKPSGNENIEFS